MSANNQSTQSQMSQGVQDAPEPHGRDPNCVDVLPSRVLIVRRGFGGKKKFRYNALVSALPEAVVHMQEDYNEDAAVDISEYLALLDGFKPDLLVAMSSGATVVSVLTDPSQGDTAYRGAVWMISAIKANRLLRHAVDLPILFSHAYEDALPAVQQIIPELSRAELVLFDGDHGAAALLQGDDSQHRIRDLVKLAMSLVETTPRAVQAAAPSLFAGLPPRAE
eukprot:TRINITY_DN11427_c0_g2_i1.p1 TRINITY_DN11427_c0_g2~~TRINITY_DN11427_c0_g2_i1.p1  ORF type:complete len:222 (+),score=39.42 TRINITY_DN11427_c0_g2_i1:223-888(+)